MGIEEGTFWDEHWVLYGNQFDNKFHTLKKKIGSKASLKIFQKIDTTPTKIMKHLAIILTKDMLWKLQNIA